VDYRYCDAVSPTCHAVGRRMSTLSSPVQASRRLLPPGPLLALPRVAWWLLGGGVRGATGIQASDIDNALWRAVAIGELLAIAPRLEGVSLHSVLKANLRACVDVVAGGNSGICNEYFRISAGRSGRRSLHKRQIGLPTWNGSSQKP
jgi:hypothetical protein